MESEGRLILGGAGEEAKLAEPTVGRITSPSSRAQRPNLKHGGVAVLTGAYSALLPIPTPPPTEPKRTSPACRQGKRPSWLPIGY